MKTVAFLAAAVLAWIVIGLGLDWLHPPPVDPAVAMAAPDAVQTKLALQALVPVLTPLGQARQAMAAAGYACAAAEGVRYTDASESGTEQARGPADVVRCDPASGSPTGAIVRRWQVFLETEGGRISFIGVGTAR